MDYEETYKGHKIRIVTSQAADGTWTSTCDLPDGEAAAPQITHASEAEARRAALSAAMAQIDRGRARTGKP